MGASLSAHFTPIANLDAETDSIQVEVANVHEYPNEAGTYCVAVLRFLKGFAPESEIVLLCAASNGTPPLDSAPIIPNNRYRISRCGDKIKTGDIFQLRLLVKRVARFADGLR